MIPICGNCEWYRRINLAVWACRLPNETAIKTAMPPSWQMVREDDSCPAFTRRQAMLQRRI